MVGRPGGRRPDLGTRQAAVVLGDEKILGRTACWGGRSWAWCPRPSAQAPDLVAKSGFFRRPLPAEASTALGEALVQGRAAGQSRELDFMPWGGGYNRVPPDATAFVHRDGLFQLKHAVVVDPQSVDG
jgi:hypothetical protein